MWPFKKPAPVQRPDDLNVFDLIELVEAGVIVYDKSSEWVTLHHVPGSEPLTFFQCNTMPVLQHTEPARHLYVCPASADAVWACVTGIEARKAQAAVDALPPVEAANQAVYEALLALRRKQLADLESRNS